MYCPNCNTALAENAKFCPKCGTAISSNAPVQSTNAPVQPTAQQPNNIPVQPTVQQPNNTPVQPNNQQQPNNTVILPNGQPLMEETKKSTARPIAAIGLVIAAISLFLPCMTVMDAAESLSFYDCFYYADNLGVFACVIICLLAGLVGVISDHVRFISAPIIALAYIFINIIYNFSSLEMWDFIDVTIVFYMMAIGIIALIVAFIMDLLWT